MSKSVKLAAAVERMLALGHTTMASAEDLKVVASFSIIADLAKNVGGDRVAITTLVGPHGDAHVYEPKPADAAAVAAAGVILINGLQFEGFLERLVEASGTKAPIAEISKGAELIPNTEDAHHDEGSEVQAGTQGEEAGGGQAQRDEDGDDHGGFDPHAWQSVPNTEIYVRNIADAFCGADPAGCETYKANAQSYEATLRALDSEIKAAISAIPEGKRVIITSHDAFGYFQHEYGITFLAPEGISTESEASAADIGSLIKQVREDKASAIFVENITNPRLVEQIASETGLRVGGQLYSDALSEEGGPADTYVSLMRHNVNTIKGAILGN